MKHLKLQVMLWLIGGTMAWTSFSGWAQSNLRVTPISGVVGQDTWRFRADGAAGMTLDVQYAVRYEDDSTATGTQDSAITFGEDGCKDVPYRDPGGVGLWFAGAYRNHAGGDWVYPEPPGVAWTIHRSGLAAAPVINRLSQEIVNQEEVTTVILYGSNFQTARSVQSSGSGLAPPVRILWVHPRGGSMAIRVDARSRQTLGIYTLGVQTSAGNVNFSLEVKPQARPFWTFCNTTVVQSGRLDQPVNSYFFYVSGRNMGGTTVSPSDPRLIVSAQSSDEDTLTGILEVRPGAQPGRVILSLNGHQLCTLEFADYCAIPVDIRPATGFINTDEKVLDNHGEPDMPELLISHEGEYDGWQINPFYREWMEKHPPEDGDGVTDGFICGFYRPVFRVNKEWNFASCRGTGTFNWDCFLNRQVGDVVGGQVFVIKFFAELDLGVHWYCGWPPGPPSLCTRGVVGMEVVGNGAPLGQTWDFCFYDPERPQVRNGRLDELTVYSSGDGCFQIQDQWRGIPGVTYFNLLQTDCCADRLPVEGAGRSADGTRWARDFRTSRGDTLLHGPLPFPVVAPVDDCSKRIDVPGRFASTLGPYRPTRSVGSMSNLLFNEGHDSSASDVFGRPRNGPLRGGCRVFFNEAAGSFGFDESGDGLPPYSPDPTGNLSIDNMNTLIADILIVDGLRYRMHMLYINGGIARIRGAIVLGFAGYRNGALVVDAAPDRTPAHEIGHMLDLDGDFVPSEPWQFFNIMCDDRYCPGAKEVTYAQCGKVRVNSIDYLGVRLRSGAAEKKTIE